MANTALNRTTVLQLTNKSGGSVVKGAVVIIDSSTAESFTTTTTAANADDTVGVVTDASIAADAIGAVAVGGWVSQINLASSASLGDYVTTHTVAGQGTPTSSVGEGCFAQVLETGTAPSATLFGSVTQAIGGTTTFTGLTDTPSSYSSQANKVVSVNSGETALEFTTPVSDFTDLGDAPSSYSGEGGNIVAVNSGETAVEFIEKSGWTLIDDQTISSSSVTQVTFSSIPQTYKHLALMISGRVANTENVYELIQCEINDDSTATAYVYASQIVFSNSSTESQSIGTDKMALGYLAGPDAVTNSAGSIEAKFLNYTDTTFFKTCHSTGAALGEGSPNFTVRMFDFGNVWKDTSAITKLDITTGGTQFEIGSRFTLYGIK